MEWGGGGAPSSQGWGRLCSSAPGSPAAMPLRVCRWSWGALELWTGSHQQGLPPGARGRETEEIRGSRAYGDLWLGGREPCPVGLDAVGASSECGPGAETAEPRREGTPGGAGPKVAKGGQRGQKA